MTANQDFAINAENIAVNIEVNAESLMQLSCTIDKVEAGTTIAPEIFSSFISPDKPSVSFAQLLSEGRIPLDISYGLQNLQIKVKGKEQNINVGLDSIKINYYLKPSAQNDLYDFGARNEISALQISGLPKPELEALAGIKKLNSSFALQRITPDAIDSYFKLIQSAKKLGTVRYAGFSHNRQPGTGKTCYSVGSISPRAYSGENRDDRTISVYPHGSSGRQSYRNHICPCGPSRQPAKTGHHPAA